MSLIFLLFNIINIVTLWEVCDAKVAVAHLNAQNISGTIYFTEIENGVNVTGFVTGLDPGLYGFHIHELGDTSTCLATGAHFNPDGTTHGGRDNKVRHVGDLGNVLFENIEDKSLATVNFIDNVITLHGRNSVLGRALVLHGQEDDLGLGGHETSLTTGNAGDRLACGVIGIFSPSEPWNSINLSCTNSPLINLIMSAVIALFCIKYV
ncbi:uncharacterized protein LOC126975977 [Leptidea sinapis]|uniref:Superoxide dismutase [Cu-Zn] n=1 Tax=Leptidea sinapis TaxID=189913 RepID=A0A5E4Q1C2_9NEOP|nr:uncharacterized protein LOC126975977 [Leptidea sinapis]VVC91249.1 unnamed protein product [Leptidea sinapis]